jgi:hypothetical protein
MIPRSIRSRGRTAAAALLAGGAGVALTVAGGASADAAVPPKCQVQHELYQQPVATIIAHVEAPASESCGVGALNLRVYRNNVLVANISGSQVALSFRYDCITTAPTAWRTNWDREVVFNCG